MPIRIAVDTNRYIDFARGESVAKEALEEASEINMPLVVLAELRAGFLCGSRSSEAERNLIKFLNSARVIVVYPDENTTHSMYASLRNCGAKEHQFQRTTYGLPRW